MHCVMDNIKLLAFVMKYHLPFIEQIHTAKTQEILKSVWMFSNELYLGHIFIPICY